MNITSYFSTLNKKHLVFLLFTSFLYPVLYFVSPLALGVLIIALRVITAVLDPYLCLAHLISTSIYAASDNVIPLSILQVLLNVIVIFSFLLHNIKKLRFFRGFAVILVSASFTAISFLIGRRPSFNTAIALLIAVFLSIQILNYSFNKSISSAIFGYITGGISITVYYLITRFLNISVTKFHRLSFEGNIKSLSVAVAFPLILLLISMLENIPLFENVKSKWLNFVLMVSFVFIFILTVARGIIIALIVGLVVYLIISRKTVKSLVKIIPFAILIIIFILLMLDSNVFNIARLFDSSEYSDGNGRVGIWTYYFDFIASKGFIHVLFGMGPGDISRFGTSSMYAHSTYLDFYFSYGLIGFISFLFVEIRLFIQILKNKCNLATVSFIVSCIVYSTHGTTVNAPLFIFQVLMLLVSENYNKLTNKFN